MPGFGIVYLAEWLRLGLRLGCGVLAIGITYVGLLTPLLMFPREDLPEHADVIFVLGPPQSWRFEAAKELIADDVSRNLLISVPGNPSDWPRECLHPEEFYFSITCFTPDPFTTQGEARGLQKQMTEHGWQTATVLTITPHVARSHLIITRCVNDGGVTLVGGGNLSILYWYKMFLYQGGAFLKAIFVTYTC